VLGGRRDRKGYRCKPCERREESIGCRIGKLLKVSRRLGEVWRSLSILAPLVKCFPPEVWGIQGKDRKLASTPMSLEDVYLIDSW